MNRKIFFLATTLLFSAGTASAEKVKKYAFGAGVQYGGIVGYQTSVQSGKSNFRVGVGYIGISAGYDYFITPKIALGVQAFGSFFTSGYGLNLNYYFSPTPSAGWMLGFDVGRLTISPIFSEDYTETGAFISAGYRF